MTARRIALAFALFFSVVLARYSLPSLSPYLGAVLDTASIGLLISAYWTAYTAFQLIGGLAVDRLGYRLSALAGLASSAVLALYPTALGRVEVLLALQAASGAFAAVVYVGMASMAIESSRGRTGLGAGLYQSAYFLASSTSLLATPYLYSLDVVLPFLAYSALMAVAGAAVFAQGGRPAKRGGGAALNKRIIAVGLARFSSGFSYLGFLSWSNYFSSATLGLPASLSGLAAFSAAVLGPLGALSGGRVGDRWGYLAPALASATLIALAVAALPWSRGAVALAIMSALGFLYGFFVAPSLAASGESSNLALASGFLNFMSQLGGAISPTLIGLALGYTSSFKIAFGLTAAVSLSALAVACAASRGRAWSHNI